jgi:alkylresorcinol/alkylpyrone synthase
MTAGPPRAVVTGAGRALPAPMDQQALWDGFFREHYADARIARKVWQSAAIRTRRGVVDPTQEDVSGLGTAARMQRFLAEAMPLGKEAVTGALADAGLEPTDVGLLTVVSCTGYVTPGLDILLARDLGMRPDVQRLHVGHMGCYAALPGLGATADFVIARQRPAVMLCLELTSLHVQPATDTARSGRPTPEDLQQMVSHALFSDAAAAVVLEPQGAEGPAGFEVVDVVARTDASTADHMTWDVTDLGFKMGLSPAVPSVLAQHARPVVEQLLGSHGLSVEQVSGWAVHPGGRRIVEVVGEVLDLPDAALAPSYDVLRDVGNCSSATVLLVLERLSETVDVPPGGYVIAMAFGPGLTLYAVLLRRRGEPARSTPGALPSSPSWRPHRP